jgi:predicted unusual protein kinase regulating ubiquinone biosynthesis (AarF/ABC1/UbiB family)
MSKIVNLIADDLRLMKCLKCNNMVEITVDDSKIKFTACCEEFGKKLKEKTDFLFEKYSEQEVKKELDIIFKPFQKKR